MERETTSQTSRWGVGVLVGVVTFSWIVMPTVLVPTAPGAALAHAATPTAAPNRVTGVELGGVGPDSVIVLIKTDHKVESYESFALPDPPRVVIDIPNAVHAVPKSLKAEGPIRQIRSSQYKTRPVKVVRIVVDLTTNLPYHVDTAPDELQVAIGEAALVAEKPEPPAIAQAAPEVEPEMELSAPPLEEEEGQVHSIDYRPQNGQAKLLVRTSGEVTFDVSETGTPPGLVVDVSGAVIDPKAAKVLDVRQLPGPVQRIRSTQYSLEPEKVVRIVVDLKGKVRHEAVQTPQGIILSLQGVTAVAAPPQPSPEPLVGQPAPVTPVVAPVPSAPPPAPVAPVVFVPPEAPAEPEIARLSMDFKDADVNNLLRIIAEVSGQNIVAGEDVKGKVTVRLVDVPWDRALDNILRINGLGFVREDNIIRVAKLSSIRKERNERRKDIVDEMEAPVTPLTTAIIRVSYADAKKMVQSLSKIKSKRGSISVDDRTASLLIQDTEANIEKMRTVLRELDTPTAQVMIEGRIVTVASEHTRSLGIQWGFQRTHVDLGGPAGRNPFVLSQLFGDTGISLPTTGTAGPLTGAVTPGVPAAVNLPIPGPAGAIGFVMGKINDTFRLQAQLTALEEESLARTLSSPRIMALDNEEAVIEQGEEIPFTTVDSSGRTTVTFKKAVLSLTVTPHVTADRRISMKVRVTDDTVGEQITFAGGFAFSFNRNEATSSLLVDDGTTVVIGGVRKRTTRINENKVPFLGSIPVLGWLFKNRTEDLKPRTAELLIFITPTIIELSPRAQR
jgi:type IV pilus assembly protein PilQ